MLAYLIVGDGRAQQLVTLFILESRGVIYFGVTRDACGQVVCQWRQVIFRLKQQQQQGLCSGWN